MIFNLSYAHLLVISLMLLTSLNCLVSYICSSVSLKVLAKTNSYAKARKRIRIYDQYVLKTLSVATSVIYVVISYWFFADLLKESDYFASLAIILGFIFSLITIVISRFCYCYACNILLSTKLNEYDVLKENFFYLIELFFPLFAISFIVPTIYLIQIPILFRDILSGIFIFGFLVIWVLASPIKANISLGASKIREKSLVKKLDGLFVSQGIKHYDLYIWDSSSSNEKNAFVSGVFKPSLFLSSSLIEELNDKELMAVVLHEIGHIKNKHSLKAMFFKLAIFVLVTFLFYYTMIINKYNIFVILGLGILFGVILLLNVLKSKKQEDEADLYVSQQGYGKELISALRKVNLDDDVCSKVDELFSSHPSLDNRINNLDKQDK